MFDSSNYIDILQNKAQTPLAICCELVVQRVHIKSDVYAKYTTN